MARTYNYAEIHALLLDASRKTFISVQQQHPHETFYAFGLFHEPLWAYIVPTCNTEEGLIRQAHRYQHDEHNLGYATRTINDLRHLLRWSTADWVYHRDLYRDHFEPVFEWLREYDPYDLGEDEWLDDAQMNAVCRSVLHTLDLEGVFGEGEDRERIVLNVLMGDQDNSWVEHARLLNSPAVYQRWVEDIESPRY
jgi:hypothetical protein